MQLYYVLGRVKGGWARWVGLAVGLRHMQVARWSSGTLGWVGDGCVFMDSGIA